MAKGRAEQVSAKKNQGRKQAKIKRPFDIKTIDKRPNWAAQHLVAALFFTYYYSLLCGPSTVHR